MQSVKRAILYPILGWGIWMTIIMVAYGMLPDDVRTSAFFVSTATVLHAILVVAFSALYLRKAGPSSAREGLYVGLTAMATVVVLDLTHNMMLSVSMSDYFARNVAVLLSIPVITTLIMGCFRKK